MIEYENLHRVNQLFFEEYRLAFEKVFQTGWFILGNSVSQFEQDFAAFNNVKYCAGVASGLDALTISLISLDLPSGSEVIVPSNTYIATILSVLHSGHIPILVEPDIVTYNIDPQKIEDAITSKTRAIIAVHLYGKPCDMDNVTEICKRRNLRLIEDCAQAHGAEYKDRKVGSFGDLSAFSFYPTKNLGCLGDGGAIVTDNEEYYRKVKMLRNYGSEKKYYNEYIGFNSRLDELQAAFLQIKLKGLDRINIHKRDLAQYYLNGINHNFVLPHVDSDYYDVYHIFNIRHPMRDELQKYLLANGVKTEIHYPVAPHRQKAMKEFSNLTFPLSEKIHNTTLSLPISFFHTKNDIERIVDLLNKFRNV